MRSFVFSCNIRPSNDLSSLLVIAQELLSKTIIRQTGKEIVNFLMIIYLLVLLISENDRTLTTIYTQTEMISSVYRVIIEFFLKEMLLSEL